MAEPTLSLDWLVAQVLASPRYRAIAPELVQHVAASELGKRRSAKATLKATKDKLHQVAGAYVERTAPYATCLAGLREAAQAQDDAGLRTHCREAMAYHASTRERLPILERFYAETLADLPRPQRVLDVACGLGPLAIPWLPLASGASYTAYDIQGDLIAFVQGFLALLPGVHGQAACRDVLGDPPREPVDLALLLKTLPCLEQLDKMAGRRLLDAIDARNLLVSFPVASLGGAQKGMPTHYEAHFMELAASRGWRVRRFSFPTELAFLVERV
jgi:16S rRNA (guanine(1405)-N(7))-methyltransferase